MQFVQAPNEFETMESSQVVSSNVQDPLPSPDNALVAPTTSTAIPTDAAQLTEGSPSDIPKEVSTTAPIMSPPAQELPVIKDLPQPSDFSNDLVKVDDPPGISAEVQKTSSDSIDSPTAPAPLSPKTGKHGKSKKSRKLKREQSGDILPKPSDPPGKFRKAVKSILLNIKSAAAMQLTRAQILDQAEQVNRANTVARVAVALRAVRQMRAAAMVKKGKDLKKPVQYTHAAGAGNIEYMPSRVSGLDDVASPVVTKVTHKTRKVVLVSLEATEMVPKVSPGSGKAPGVDSDVNPDSPSSLLRSATLFHTKRSVSALTIYEDMVVLIKDARECSSGIDDLLTVMKLVKHEYSKTPAQHAVHDRAIKMLMIKLHTIWVGHGKGVAGDEILTIPIELMTLPVGASTMNAIETLELFSYWSYLDTNIMASFISLFDVDCNVGITTRLIRIISNEVRFNPGSFVILTKVREYLISIGEGVGKQITDTWAIAEVAFTLALCGVTPESLASVLAVDLAKRLDAYDLSELIKILAYFASLGIFPVELKAGMTQRIRTQLDTLDWVHCAFACWALPLCGFERIYVLPYRLRLEKIKNIAKVPASIMCRYLSGLAMCGIADASWCLRFEHVISQMSQKAEAFDGDTAARAMAFFLRTSRGKSRILQDLYIRIKRYQRDGRLSEGALDEVIYALVASPGLSGLGVLYALSATEIKGLLNTCMLKIRPATAARLLSIQVRFIDTEDLLKDVFDQFFSDRKASLETILTAGTCLWSRGWIHSNVGLRLCQRLQEIPPDGEVNYEHDPAIFRAMAMLNLMNYPIPSHMMAVVCASLANGPGTIPSEIYIDMLTMIALNPGPWDKLMPWFKKEAVLAAKALDELTSVELKNRAYFCFSIWAAMGHVQSVALLKSLTSDSISEAVSSPRSPRQEKVSFKDWYPVVKVPIRIVRLQELLRERHVSCTLHPACDLLIKQKLAVIYADPSIKDLKNSQIKHFTVLQRLKFRLLQVLKFEVRIIGSKELEENGATQRIARELGAYNGKYGP